KAPACESRGFVRKIMKVCILTHLLFYCYRLIVICCCKNRLYPIKSLRRSTKLLLKYFSRTILFSASSSGVP
ncbi:hypothetical protein ABH086_17495, partial [Bacteroides stercoris]